MPAHKLCALLVLIVSLLLGAQAQAYTASIPFDQQVVPLERNGVRLHLDRIALANTQPAKQILLVHGLTYSSHEFDVDYADYSLARFLATQGYAVWRLDVAGYGSSEDVKDGFMPNSDYAAEDRAEYDADPSVADASGYESSSQRSQARRTHRKARGNRKQQRLAAQGVHSLPDDSVLRARAARAKRDRRQQERDEGSAFAEVFAQTYDKTARAASERKHQDK